MVERTTHLNKLENQVHDAIVIGAGINGAISALRLSTAGYQTILIDKNDFASSTSQQSSNLVWGGIKYMENYEFPLVRHLCLSRNEMMRAYPSQIKEIRFFATHSKQDPYPLFVYRLGTWLYWLLGNFYTKKPKKYNVKEISQIEGCIVTEQADGAIEYSDSYLPENDSRFVYRLAHKAKENGANILNYMKALNAKRENNLWFVECQDQLNTKKTIIRARVIINCAGPYADEVNQQNKVNTKYQHILSKGVHLIVPKIQKTDSVLTFLSDDKRPFFVIPMKHCSCIGTTDTPTKNPLEGVTEQDRQFVLDNINKRIHFTKPLTKESIIAERCGVRPLVQEKGKTTKGDWVAISRKHAVEANQEMKSLTIFGGKLTDCLNVAEEVLAITKKWLKNSQPIIKNWYGEPNSQTKQKLLQECKGIEDLAEKERLYKRYDTRMQLISSILAETPNAQEKIFPQAEYRLYDLILMAKTEDIIRLEDLLRRRTELELTIKKEEMQSNENLKLAVKLIFQEQFQEKWDEYFQS